MKRILVVLVLALAACGSDGDDAGPASSAPGTLGTIPVTAPPEVPEEFDGSWVVVSADEQDAPDGVTLVVSSGGGLSGFLGCNEWFGSLSTTDGTTRFVDLTYSEVGCADVGDFVTLIESLERVTAVEVAGDGATATLSSPDGPEVLLERAGETAPA